MLLYSWIILLFFSQFGVNDGFLFKSFQPIIKPFTNKLFVVNQTATISCSAQNGQASLFKNASLIQSKNTTIKYNFTSVKPAVYIFKCNSGNTKNEVKITFRYMPEIVSAKAVISSYNMCHMRVNFTINHFKGADYMTILRFNNTLKKYENCSYTNICEFHCFWGITYQLNVKFAFNQYETSSNWTFQATKKIYKLEKLKEIKILDNNSQSLNLSYSITNDNEKIETKNCLYKIEYTSEWDPTPKYLITNKTKVVLNNLVPYTTYRIEVQAKINQSFYWSEKAILQKRTLSSAPFKGPQSTNGSYLETTCKDESKRCFFLYWEMIPMPLRNGILDAYIIRQNGRLLLETSEIFASIKNQPRNKDLWFEIQAKNNNSLYSPKTIIHIPPIASVLQGPKGVFAVKLNDTHLNISWSLPNNLTENHSVTLMSCFGEKLDSNSLFCQSNLIWTRIENKSFAIIKAEKETNFAAYVSNSNRSSSLTLVKCIFNPDRPVAPSRPILLKKSSSTINLLWPQFDCVDLRGRPFLFQVLYSKGKNSCTNGSAINIEAIGIKPENEKITLKNLKPFQNYSICLRIKNQNGWSKMSRQFHIETLESNPSSSVRNLSISNTSQNLVALRWEPTLDPNGIITYHVIYYNKFGSKEVNNVSSDASNMATVSNLIPATKYSFAVSTCNKAGCSLKSSYLIDKTLKEEKEIFFVIILPIILVSIIMIFLICLGRYLFRKMRKTYATKIEVPAIISDKTNFHEYETIDRNSLTSIIESQTISDSENSIQSNDSFIDSDSRNLIKKDKLNSNSHHLIQNKINSIEFDSKDQNLTEQKSDGTKSSGLTWINSSQNKNVENKTGFCQNDSESENLSKNQGKLLKPKIENLDLNGYLFQIEAKPKKAESKKDKKMDLNQTELGLINCKKWNGNLSELNQVDTALNGYVANEMKSSEPRFDNSGLNGYISNEMNSSESTQAGSSLNGYIQNKMNSSESTEDDSSLSGYVQNKMNSSESTQADSSLNGYVQNKMNSSESTQADSSLSGYVQNKMNSSESTQADSSLSGYVQNKMNSSESTQADSSLSGYVQNKMNSSESTQADSSLNGYIQNKMNSSESTQADSSLSGYIQNKMKSSESTQAGSSLSGYVQNKMNSSESTQADSSLSGYVQNKMNSSESTQDDSSLSGYVQNKMNSSESTQADSSLNGYIPNEINSSESTQADSSLSGYIQNKMNSSESTQAESSLNGYIQNKMNSSESTQAGSSLNGYVQNKMNSSESTQADSSINGYVQNKMNSSESTQADSSLNGYIPNEINSFDSSQADSGLNDYVQNKMNLSDSSLNDSSLNGYIPNEINSSESSLTDSGVNDYVPNKMSFSESTSDDSSLNGYIQNKMNLSEPSKTDSALIGYVQNKMNSSDLTQNNSSLNGYIPNKINSSSSSQPDSSLNGYVLNKMSSSESTKDDSGLNSYVHNKMNSSDSSLTGSSLNGYIPNEMNSSESSQADSSLNNYIENKKNLSEASKADSDSNKLNPIELSQANSSLYGYVCNEPSTNSHF